MILGMVGFLIVTIMDIIESVTILEKARGIDPFGHAGLTPLGKIRLTPFE